MNRQPRTLLTLLLIAVIVGTGYLIWRDVQPPPTERPGGSEPAEVSTRGGQLTATLRSEPRSFNRLAVGNVATDLITHLTQSRLVRVNRSTSELEPGLAERWTISPDGQTFTLTLREGLRWSDGEPFTSADVEFTFKALYDPKVASVLKSTFSVGGQPLAVSTPDPRTVVITLPAPFGPGVRLLDGLPILPRHKLQAALASGEFARAWTAATPSADLAGTGPFKLEVYEPGQRLVFVRNDHFWRKAPDGVELPYLDRLVLEIVPDQNAELLHLQSGQVDMMSQQIRPEDIAALRPLRDQEKVKLIELGVSLDPNTFFFNLREPYWAKDPRAPWILKRELRQAISHAVDREALADAVFLGAAVPVWGPVTPGNKDWFSPNVPRYPQSLEKARDLLKSIGLTNRDQDEWLEDERGTDARVTVLTFSTNLILEREAAFVRDALRKLGVALDLVSLEPNALIDRMLKGDFEAIFFNYTVSNVDPALSTDFWLSSGSARVWNLSQPTPATEWEAQMDELMKQQITSLDPAERHRLFAEVQRVFAENVPALYFVAPRLYMGTSTRVINLTPSVLRPQLLWAADTIAMRP